MRGACGGWRLGGGGRWGGARAQLFFILTQFLNYHVTCDAELFRNPYVPVTVFSLAPGFAAMEILTTHLHQLLSAPMVQQEQRWDRSVKVQVILLT